MDAIFPNCYKVAFRFHKTNEMTLQDVSLQLSNYEHHSGHIVAYEEDAERPHYQGYMLLSNEDKKNDKVRKYFKKVFNLQGNKDYSITTVKDVKSYKKYLMKEGNWISQGMDVTELIKYQSISYPKKKKFQEELDDLEIRYINESMDDLQYIFEFMKLKGKYRQVININYIKQRLLMLISRCHSDRLKKIAYNLSEEVKRLEEPRY